VGEKVKLEYKNSFFAFFNPPNLRELVPGGASKGFFLKKKTISPAESQEFCGAGGGERLCV
jgi:hypothetical protein